MKAIQRVKNKDMQTIGFILEDGHFYSDFYVKSNIEYIENLKILSNNTIRCTTELPIILYSQLIKNEYSRLRKENPFVREIQKDLEEWRKNPLHNVLQLEGSRQSGKTTELKKFAYKNYDYVIYVNLADDKYHFIETVTNKGSLPLNVDIYCKNANLPVYVDTSKTILIIDEIQESSLVYSSIRSLHENLKCDIIVTGSYLGRIIGNRDFFLSAGTVTYLKMFPLSFKEFCKVFGYEKLLMNIDLYGKSLEKDYNSLFSLYDIYRQIGGYPAVVQEYKKFKNIDRCLDVISMLLETFKQESKHYFKNDKEIMIFDNVYVEVIKEMKNEKKGTGLKLVENITNLIKDSQKCILSRDEVSRAIRWIIYSGLIGECGLVTMRKKSDIINVEPARRVYYLDCGLANCIARKAGISVADRDGILTETFAFSEFYKLFFEKPSTTKVLGEFPCFSIYNNFELDFLIQSSDNVVFGVEVKTERGNPKSLKEFVKNRLLDKGVLAKHTKGGHGPDFDTIPIFAVACRFPYK